MPSASSVFRRARPLVASCALACAALSSPLAFAAGASPLDATDVQKQQALSQFVAGKKSLEAKDWDAALLQLRASLEIVDSPNARLELARALRDSGDPEDAWTEYGRALDDATRFAATESRYQKTVDAAKAERDDLATKVALVQMVVKNAPAGAVLRIGTRAIPTAQWEAPIAVHAGTVDVFVVDDANNELAHATTTAVVGQKQPLDVDATPPPPSPPTESLNTSDDDRPEGARTVTAAPPPPKPSALRPAAYVAGAVGVVGLGAFAAFGLMSSSSYSDLKSACHPGCPADKQSEIDSGRTQQLVANIGLGVGIAGLAAGATLWFVSAPRKAPPPSAASLVVHPVIGPAYIGVRGSL